jgi:hypothetical protein|tara:strand:+ start:302 stop:559 length:258 start_codon:yes stop_codon:yes gene_type:complete
MIDCKCSGSYKGSCCCNCKYRLELTKHPWNEHFIGSCSTNAQVLNKNIYACASPIDAGRQKAVLMEWEHGMCEQHENKEIKKTGR